MSKTGSYRLSIPRGDTAEPSDELRDVVSWIYGIPEGRERFRWALRDSLDELMDGQRTGRWCYQHLSKPEKTHLGTSVEVNLTKEFGIDPGEDLDWRIAGIDLDCKFSRDLGGWEIPMEMYICPDHGSRSGKADQIAMLVWLDDDRSEWAAGLMRITDQRLGWRKRKNSDERERGYNRDNKRKIDRSSFQHIFWLWGGVQSDLPTNLLLHLDAGCRDRILKDGSGQARVNQLFREVTGRIINRYTVLTVAQQDDSPKRVRDARSNLKNEGYVILGHESAHKKVADRLGLQAPVKGEWLSARLTRVESYGDRPSVCLGHHNWAVAREGENMFAAPPENGLKELPIPDLTGFKE